MADHGEDLDKKKETLLEKIVEKVHGEGDSSSSSSDSESEKKTKEKLKSPPSPSSVKNKVFRLFGREKPVHQVFGGGKRTVTFFFSNPAVWVT